MRKVHVLGVGLVGAAIAIACGGSSSNPPSATGNDAGLTNDGSVIATDSGPGSGNSTDGAANGSDDAGVCVIDADLNTLAPVDAALDDAGDSVGTCLGCVKTSCSSQLTTCNGDCTCNTEFACFAGCIGGVGNTIFDCLGCFPNGYQAILSNPVVTCASSSCIDPCALSSLLGGGGGTKDAGNGGTPDSGPSSDASTDASAD